MDSERGFGSVVLDKYVDFTCLSQLMVSVQLGTVVH